MDNEQDPGCISPIQATRRIYDGNFKSTGQKTAMVGFRIFKSQHETLIGEYSGNASALVRILLAKYFTGALPEVEAEFKSLLTE